MGQTIALRGGARVRLEERIGAAAIRTEGGVVLAGHAVNEGSSTITADAPARTASSTNR